MAIIPWHRRITETVLGQFSFTDPARHVCAEANVKVDEKQGNSADEANLHAMRGFVLTVGANLISQMHYRMQSEDDARKAVTELLRTAADNTVDQIREGDHRMALQTMGAALHTVQDEQFHHYEPWPHKGIVDAITQDLNYMVMHGVRDLGVVSKAQIRTTGVSIKSALELTVALRKDVYLSGELFHETPVRSRAFRFTGPVGRDEGWNGSGGMFTLTFGAAPGSLPSKQSSTVDGLTPEPVHPLCTELTRGPAVLAQAKERSYQYVQGIQRRVDSRLWDEFRQGGEI